MTGTIYLASISTLLIACCYWKRANNWGAAAAIVVGAVIPIACLVIEQFREHAAQRRAALAVLLGHRRVRRHRGRDDRRVALEARRQLTRPGGTMMLSETQREVLGGKTRQLLWDVGMKVESGAIAAAMLARGCRQAPSGRIRVPRQLIEEMTASQRPTQDADQRDQELHYYCGVDWAHHVIWHKKQEDIRRALETRLLMSAFDCGPTTYYDYQSHRSVPVDTTIFIEMMKFAQATPEIGYISTWYRQDVPQAIERIESLILGLKHTDKVDGIEAIDPAAIKYLKEISEIVTAAARRLQLSRGLRMHHLAADS